MKSIFRTLKDTIDQFQVKKIDLTEEQLKEKELCEQSFYEFCKRAWKQVEGTDLIDGWHIEAICAHLEALYDMEIKNLLINIPFRTGKSMFCSVLFPAWVWTQDASESFIYASYAEDLATRDNEKTLALIKTDWYQSLWGNEVQPKKGKANKKSFILKSGGRRRVTSVRGAATGYGANFIVCDDANSITEIESEAVKLKTISWWNNVMSSRFNLFRDRRRLCIQQRSDVQDLSGAILSKNDPSWVHLRLPMEFEPWDICKTVPLRLSHNKTWVDPRREDKELLWPNGINEKELDQIKKDFNYDSYVIAGQLQQRPSPTSGGIFRRDWFKKWKQPDYPEFEYVLQSWDTALTGNKTSAFSACTTWGVFKERDIYNVMFLSLYQGQIEYPDLRKMAVRLSKNWEDTNLDHPTPGRNPVDIVLIEAKVSGYCLFSDLMNTNIPVMKFNPNKAGDKVARARTVTHIIENGLVWLPTSLPKCEHFTQDAQKFLEAAILFPNDKTKDIIDSMSQAFIRLLSSGWLFNKEDPQPEKVEPWKKENAKYW